MKRTFLEWLKFVSTYNNMKKHDIELLKSTYAKFLIEHTKLILNPNESTIPSN